MNIIGLPTEIIQKVLGVLGQLPHNQVAALIKDIETKAVTVNVVPEEGDKEKFPKPEAVK